MVLVNRRPGVRDRSDGLAELVITMRGVRGRAGNPGARRVEGLPARVVVKADGDPDAMATEIEDRVVGASVAPLFPGADQVGSRFGLADYYVVTLPTRRGSAASIGHDIAYELEKTPGVGRSFYEGVYRGFRVLGGAPGDNDAKAPADHDWSHQHVGLSATAARGGAGVVIGHPDTGWADHPELDRNRLDLTRQRNFVRVPETADARDPLTQAGNPGHGTSTGSVMISGPTPNGVVGVCQGANLLPIRVINSVVLLRDVTVAKGLWYLAQQNVDVVSMSLGGYPAQFLESVVLHAVFERDMIVCAAAGNYWPVVVAPAAYESCIGVAATTPTDRPWLYSASGPAVDISAPGHLVWCADFDARTRNPSPHAGSGTSFAVPHVAGAAALWLAHHGKVTVQREAGGRPLQFVFKSLLQQTARVPGRYDSNVGFDDLQLAPGSLLGDSWPIDQRGLTRFGPGILDVDRLLAAPLRDASSSASTSDPATGLTSWVKIVEGILCAYPVWREALEVLFGQSGDDLDGLIEGYGAELSKLFMDATSSNAADPVRVFLTAVADWADAVATQEALALDPSAPPAVAAAAAQAAAAAWAAVEAAAAAAAQALAAAASAALKALFPWL